MTDPTRVALRAVWDGQRDSVLRRVDVLDDALAAAATGTLEDGRREAAERQAHMLAGSAGTFGFPEASEHARRLERALAAPGGPSASEVAGLVRLAARLRADLRADASDATVPDDGTSVPRGALEVLIVGVGAPADALLDEARSRGLTAGVARSLPSARRILSTLVPELVLVDLGVEERPEAALGLVAELSEGCVVVALADPDGVADRVDVARAGARGLLEAGIRPAEALDWCVEVRDRVRATDARVLAVDDDPVALASLCAVLQTDGLVVQTTTDPRGVFELLARSRPDLVVLDVDMPAIDGIDLCRTIRNDRAWRTLPIILLTARTDSETLRRAFEAGADDFVTKPIVGPELAARVGSRLERTRLFRELAHTDALTRLDNRRHGLDEMRTLLGAARRHSEPAAVAVLDADGFKPINDLLGHAAGDEALRAVADELRAAFRSEDVVSRWGGDEFVVGMRGMTETDARQRLGELLESVREADIGGGRAGRLTLSAGMAVFPADGEDVETLLQAADEALLASKRAGGDRVVVYAAAQDRGDRVDVVLVEDDVDLGRLLVLALETRGYNTRWLTDGAQAAHRLAGPDPDLTAPVILLDWQLPGVDGVEILRRLGERGALSATRVIMLTVRATEADALRAFDAGAVDHVAKPFSVPLLLRRVARAMDRR